jgi:hypothetical protein
MGGLSLFHYIVVFIYIAILVIPVVKILNKADFSVCQMAVAPNRLTSSDVARYS